MKSNVSLVIIGSVGILILATIISTAVFLRLKKRHKDVPQPGRANRSHSLQSVKATGEMGSISKGHIFQSPTGTSKYATSDNVPESLRGAVHISTPRLRAPVSPIYQPQMEQQFYSNTHLNHQPSSNVQQRVPTQFNPGVFGYQASSNNIGSPHSPSAPTSQNGTQRRSKIPQQYIQNDTQNRGSPYEISGTSPIRISSHHSQHSLHQANTSEAKSLIASAGKSYNSLPNHAQQEKSFTKVDDLHSLQSSESRGVPSDSIIQLKVLKVGGKSSVEGSRGAITDSKKSTRALPEDKDKGGSKYIQGMVDMNALYSKLQNLEDRNATKSGLESSTRGALDISKTAHDVSKTISNGGKTSSNKTGNSISVTINVTTNPIMCFPAFLECPINHIVFGKVLGSGGMGQVFQATLFNPDLLQRYSEINGSDDIERGDGSSTSKPSMGVAAKKFQFSELNIGDRKMWLDLFQQELSINYALSNCPRIAAVIGTLVPVTRGLVVRRDLNGKESYQKLTLFSRRNSGWSVSGDEYIMLSKMFRTDLQNQIDRREPLPFWQIAKDISEGVAYMHGRNFVHNDLKPGNIFLERILGSDGNLTWRAVISDFGITFYLGEEDVKIRKKIEVLGVSYRHASPQALLACRSVGKGEVINPNLSWTKNDVYAYGVILWEMVMMESSWKGMSYDEIAETVIRGGRLPLHQGAMANHPIKSLIISCWEQEAVSRPDFDIIMEEVTQLQEAGKLRNARSDNDTTVGFIELTIIP